MIKKFLLLSIILILLLTACKDNKKISTEEDSDLINSKNQIEKSDQVTETENSEEVKSVENEEETENSEEVKSVENEEKIENSEDENKKETDEIGEAKNIEEEIENLAKISDYVSIIKMSQTGSTGKEIHVIEDLKGSLKNIVIPDIPNIQANTLYLIFLKDSETGDITLSHSEKGVMKLENENDEKFVYINEILKTEEENTDEKIDDE